MAFEEAVSGNCEELTKLTLLLLYIALFTDSKLRGRLVNSNSLDQGTQARVSTADFYFEENCCNRLSEREVMYVYDVRCCVSL